MRPMRLSSSLAVRTLDAPPIVDGPLFAGRALMPAVLFASLALPEPIPFV